MVRVITQNTYDEVVKENIEEFDMTPEEAIKEAIAQFEAQGVDLSNIIKDLTLGPGGDHLVSTTVTKLTKPLDDDDILKELEILKTECNKDIAHRVRAGKDGAYTLLIKLLEEKLKIYAEESNENNVNFIESILNSLIALMDTQPDLLQHKDVNIIKSILDKVKDERIQIAALKWASTCCIKHEMNRQHIFKSNIIENFKVLLKSKNKKIISEALNLIRKLTLDDDIRFEFGKAHDHAKEMGAQLLETLTDLLIEYPKPPLVSEIMLTISSLLVRHELCLMVSMRGESTLFTVLTENYESVSVAQQACKLITALAGNDDVKRSLVKSGIVPIIVSLLYRHSNNVNAAALMLKCVAALALREPLHSTQFMENGVADAIVDCLKKYPDDSSVQKNACWAIRNLVARSREHNPKFHELGIEPLLNKAIDKFGKDFGFDIKSALRDLECDVKLEEQWTGKGVEIEN